MASLTWVLLLAVAACVFTTGAQEQPYDLLIVNGQIIDGTGNPATRADIAIRGDVVSR